MPRNDHKKVLLELSQAYNQVQEGWQQKVGEAGRRIAGAFKRKKKEPESKEEKPAPKEKPKVSRSAGKYGTAIADPGWKGDVDPTDISAKRKSGKSYEDRKRWGVVTKADREQLRCRYTASGRICKIDTGASGAAEEASGQRSPSAGKTRTDAEETQSCC